jgi:LmeA-like phospholipid-binding
MTVRQVLATALLLEICGGCARPGEKKAERAVEELLPHYLGPAKSYKAQVKAASLGALMRGRVRTVKIIGREVQLLPECTVAELTVDATEIEVDKSRQSLKSVGEARFVARIEERELDRLVRARRPRLVDLKVALRGSLVSVRVTPELLGYPTVPVQVEGSLLTRGGGVMLDFEPDKARLLIVPIPKPALDFVAERINPVVDFSALKAPIRVERAEVRGGSLYLSGYLPPESVTNLGITR